MKKTTLFLTLLLSLTFALVISAAADDSIACFTIEGTAIQDGYIEDYYDRFNFYSTGSLDSYDTKALADAFTAGWTDHAEQIDLSEFNIPLTDASMIGSFYSQVLNENPHFFYVRGQVSVYYNTNTNLVTSFAPIYVFSSQELEEAKPAFEAAVNDFLATIDSSMTNLEKVIAIHDYLVLKGEYDLETYNNRNDPDLKDARPTSFTSYGILVEGMGVCQSYTLAFTVLCNEIGIENTTVQSSTLAHIWNMINLDNEWYHVDVTWDDPTADKKGLTSYSNFLKTDTEFMSAGKANHVATDWVKGVDNAVADSDAYSNAFWTKAYSNMARYSGAYYFATGNTATTEIHCATVSNLESTSLIRTLENLRWKLQNEEGLKSRGLFAVVPFVYNGELYYNTIDSVYKYNNNEESDTLVYSWEIEHGFIVPVQILTNDCVKIFHVSRPTASEAKYYYNENHSIFHYCDKGTVVPPTYDSEGYTQYVCDRCAVSYEEDFIPAVTKINGDVNKDLKIDNYDVIALARYLAHWTGYEDIVYLTNCDVNSSDDVDSFDLIFLARALSNWTGYSLNN